MLQFYSHKNELDAPPAPGSPQVASAPTLTPDVLSSLWRTVKHLQSLHLSFRASNGIPRVLGGLCKASKDNLLVHCWEGQETLLLLTSHHNYVLEGKLQHLEEAVTHLG